MENQINNHPVRHNQSPFISIIVVAFNNSEDVISCLKSIKNQSFQRFEVVIVDNASNQAEIDSITSFIDSQPRRQGVGASTESSEWPKMVFLKNLKNTGYSGGNNLGIKYAMNPPAGGGAEEILILNPDTIAAPHLLEEMHQILDSNKALGAVGPIIDESFGQAQNQGTRKIVGGIISWLKPELDHINKRSRYNSFADNGEESGARKSYVGGAISSSKLSDNRFLTGACILIKREVFEKVGLFDERYFLYFEDTDFCVRVQKAGYKLGIADKAKLHHKVSATTSKLGTARLLRYHYRNTHLFNMKHAPLWAFILLPFWSILIIIKQLLKLAIGKEKQISKEILLGVLDFYIGRFGKI